MRNLGCIACILLLSCLASAEAAKTAFEYPSAILDSYGAGQTCWYGMGVTGAYPVRVVPPLWLVGTPPSEHSAVTLPADDWVDLLFSGRLVPADGNDLQLIELGQCGEQALVFLIDGTDQEYPVGLAQASNAGVQLPTYIGLKLPSIPLPFEPRALRIVALDDLGASPGFDLASARAWVSHDCTAGVSNPNLVNGVANVQPDVKLSWTPACQAKEHIVYLAADESQVRAAAQQAWRARQPRDANVFDPRGLMLGRTYYWRIDEVMDGNDLLSGPLWHFTVDDHILVDDFDSYDSQVRPIESSWVMPGSPPYGSNRAWRYLETGSVWHSCQQSMAFQYYYDASSNSEVWYPFSQPPKWGREGVRAVQFWLYGAAGNATNGQMYVVVADWQGHQETAPFTISDSTSLTRSEWTVCRASLAGFSQVDLNDVWGIGIGFRLPAGVSSQGSSGTIHVDDVSLLPSVCLDSSRPSADLNADCAVNYRDVSLMASQWLTGGTHTCEVTEPNDPIVWYRFDGDVDDSMGNAPGDMDGRPTFAPGKHGQAIRFGNPGDSVTIPQANSVFALTRSAITIAFWQWGTDSTHLNDTICCSNYVYGQSSPSISINLGLWKNPGQYRWDCGTPWSFADRVAGRHQDKLEWTGRWNHWAFTKDIRVGPPGAKGRMEIYLNGVLYDSRSGTDSPIEDITTFEIGSGWYGRYDGMIDDFQIYDYALSAPEAAYLASDGTGVLEAAVPPAADLDRSDRVDFTDFAILASQWLASGLWP